MIIFAVVLLLLKSPFFIKIDSKKFKFLNDRRTKKRAFSSVGEILFTCHRFSPYSYSLLSSSHYHSKKKAFGECDDGVESSSSSSQHHHPVELISSRLRADDDDDFFPPFRRRRRSRCQSGRSRRLGAAASS